MTNPTDDEQSRRVPFWMVDNVSDGEVVYRLLRQRFPEVFDILASSLEEADPLEVVYPGNPDEYSDVVCEILVLLAFENADLTQVDRSRLALVVTEGLSRRFGEEIDEVRTALAVDLILNRVEGTRNMEAYAKPSRKK